MRPILQTLLAIAMAAVALVPASIPAALPAGLASARTAQARTLDSPASQPAQQGTCQFVLGFATLASLVGSQTVGTCLENQRSAANGNAEQLTSKGLMAWRKADNWTAFTNGYETWINGPNGLAKRLNTEGFSWESDAAGFPAVPAAPVSVSAPVLAWYYPQFTQGLDTDFRNAEQGGIDAFIVSETGTSNLDPYLARSRSSKVQVVLGVETTMHPNADALIQRLKNVLSSWGNDPGYLHYQGKPVLVFWQLPAVPSYRGQSPQQTWQSIRNAVDPGRTSIWIGEGGDVGTTISYMPAFDGLHLYSIAWSADPAQALSGWANRLRAANPNLLWVATVMPGGYFGSGSDPSQWQSRDRQNGNYFRAAWRGAIATNPAMVIITSYNETNERTEIHPTPTWSNLYLDINREMAASWRGR